ncbi:hypothetical protein FRC01_007794 [Tulasnella sp. 417]|nr:hypothetical protein FRC01_007794 [Tulasnella sp. 417]
MTVTPLYLQRIRECLKIKDESLRRNTWTTLAEPVSVLLEISEGEDLLESVFSDSEEEFDVFQKLVESHPHKSTVRYPAAPTDSAKLSEYASVATLPSMPWRPRRQGPCAERKPDNVRNLRSVRQIPTQEFCDRVLAYQKARPASDANRFPKQLRVPHEDYPFVQSAGCVPPDAEKSLNAWVRQIPLQTAECLLHNTEPRSKGWGFGSPTSMQGQSDEVFKSEIKTKSGRSMVQKLLVEVKCPWTLPLAEMEKIPKFHHGLPSLLELEAAGGGQGSGTSSPTSSPGRQKKPAYTSAQRALAQAYDYGKEQKHHFFIITTYEHWMFGVFSRDYTGAAVTEPLPYTHKGPTIIQCITYWLQSSLFLPGSFEIPEVSASLDEPAPSILHATSTMWERTLQNWRNNSIKELQRNQKLSGHIKARKLMDTCCASLKKLETSSASPASRDTDLLARCRDIVNQMQPPPRSPPEWTVITTWLALVLDPITFDDDLQSLERAFVKASDWDPEHPITEDHTHRKRKALVDSRGSMNKSARMLQPNDSLDGDGGIVREFYWQYASKEVAIVLDRYLPHEIRLQLQQWHLRALLATCGPRNLLSESRHFCCLNGPPGPPTITEIRSAIAAPKPAPPGPPKRKPRATIGTPAEVRILKAEAQQRTLRSSFRGKCLDAPSFSK